MRLKLVSLFLLFGLLGSLLGARLSADEPGQEILFQPKQLFPAQGGPAVKYATFPAGRGVLVGGTGGVVLGRGFGLGFAGYSLATELLADVNNLKRDIGMSYGGLHIENSFLSRRLFYLNTAIIMGGGQSWSVTREAGAQREYATFFIAEPELNVMLNVTHEIRMGLGISYRATAGADLAFTLGSPLSGFAGTLTMYYGKL
jgi:hypothetical protein